MTQLLVSVADAQEAREAVENGADLIDVKDPTAGSLGAATVEKQREVIMAVASRFPVSVALGELLDLPNNDKTKLPQPLAFAKVGLSHCRSNSDWLQRWRAWQQSLSANIQAVAVSYVDWQTCGAPSPGEIIQQLVVPSRCRILLFDTFDKRQGSLLDHCSLPVLRDLCASLRSHDCRIVLAGSLQLQLLPALLPLQADYVAVRGAVCREERTSRLSGALVHEWATALARQAR